LVLSVPGAPETLTPSLLVDAAVHRDERGFLLLYGDASILLVEIPPGASELQQGLGELEAAIDPLPFHTEVQPLASHGLARTHVPEDPGKLARLLSGRVHFAFALRKPASSDAVSDRISVGRARNKDLVLRHQTISKFHAWFETGDDGALYLSDAESRNQTRVNGSLLAPRARHPVAPGDSVRFGSVDCLLCSPATLWACLRLPSPRTVRPPSATSRPPTGSR
jgi:hypothetical protein